MAHHTPWEDRVRAVQQAIGPDLHVIDHETFLQILDADRTHLALVGLDPLQVEIDLSVVILSAHRDPEELLAEADRLIERVDAEVFAPRGFQLGPEGELVEAEAVADPDRIIPSWDRPTTALVPSLEELGPMLQWIRAQRCDFVL